MKYRKPTSPGQRGMVVSDFSDLIKPKRKKRLVVAHHRFVGRSRGKITVRHKGSGAKRLYRLVDFKQDKFDISATVLHLEYDPNRSARIAFVQYKDGEKRYVLATQDTKPGDEIMSSEKKIALINGNRMPLKHITIGTFVHNIELGHNRGGMLARSAGAYGKVAAQEGASTHIIMPSSEVRIIQNDCLATVGVASNASHSEEVIGKAGRNRHKGIRPTVRGTAMNPVDHPHGGGEGRAPIGMPHPKTPWGKPALGVKTRDRRRYSNRLIVQRRRKK